MVAASAGEEGTQQQQQQRRRLAPSFTAHGWVAGNEKQWLSLDLAPSFSPAANRSPRAHSHAHTMLPVGSRVTSTYIRSTKPKESYTVECRLSTHTKSRSRWDSRLRERAKKRFRFYCCIEDFTRPGMCTYMGEPSVWRHTGRYYLNSSYTHWR